MPTDKKPDHVMAEFIITAQVPISTELPAAETAGRLAVVAEVLGGAFGELFKKIMLHAAKHPLAPVPISRVDPEREAVEQGMPAHVMVAAAFGDAMTQAELEAWARETLERGDASDRALKAKKDAEHAERQAASKTEAEAMLLKVFGAPDSNRAPPSDMPPDATRH